MIDVTAAQARRRCRQLLAALPHLSRELAYLAGEHRDFVLEVARNLDRNVFAVRVEVFAAAVAKAEFALARLEEIEEKRRTVALIDGVDRWAAE